MYKKLTVIVDRGMAEEVMDVAHNAGTSGGTIMRAGWGQNTLKNYSVWKSNGKGTGSDPYTQRIG